MNELCKKMRVLVYNNLTFEIGDRRYRLPDEAPFSAMRGRWVTMYWASAVMVILPRGKFHRYNLAKYYIGKIK